jgi:hypothetical protein
LAMDLTTYQLSTPILRCAHPPTTTPSSDETNSTRTTLATSCGQRREI